MSVSRAPARASRRRSGPAPGRCPTALLRALDVTIGRRIEGCSPATTARRCSATAPSSRRSGRTSRATTCARSTGTSPRARASRTSACTLAERVLVTWLVLDTSPSMQFGTADRRKADVAEGVAIAVGHVATRRGNRLGVVDVRRRARRRRCRRARAASACSGCSPRCATSRSEAQVGATSLGEALARTRRARAPARARRRRLRLPRAARLAQAAARSSPAATTWSRSRSATRASRSCRTSASSGSSTPRPAGSCASTRAARKLRDRFAAAAAEERSGVARVARRARRPPRRALDVRATGCAPLAVFLRRSAPVSFASPARARRARRRAARSSLLYVRARAAARRARPRASRNPALLPNLVDRAPGLAPPPPARVLLVALAALIVGVARPHATVTRAARGGDGRCSRSTSRAR